MPVVPRLFATLRIAAVDLAVMLFSECIAVTVAERSNSADDTLYGQDRTIQTGLII